MYLRSSSRVPTEILYRDHLVRVPCLGHLPEITWMGHLDRRCVAEITWLRSLSWDHSFSWYHLTERSRIPEVRSSRSLDWGHLTEITWPRSIHWYHVTESISMRLPGWDHLAEISWLILEVFRHPGAQRWLGGKIIKKDCQKNGKLNPKP